MEWWLTLIVEFATVLIVNGCFYYGINKKLKQVQVNEKEIEVIKKQDDEWQELYNELKSQIQPLQEKIEIVTQEKHDLARGLLMKDVEIEKLKSKINQLEWYRCTVNGCNKRRPPHVFDQEGNELTAINNH